MNDRYDIEEIAPGESQYDIEELPVASKKSPLPDFMRMKLPEKNPLYHPGFPGSIVEGINEGAERGTAAIFGKNLPQKSLPTDEWERGGQQAGRFIGGMAPFTGLAAATAITGGAAGVPAAEALGIGAGAYATTPGTVAERGLSALEALAVPKALKLGVKAIDKLIATPLANFIEGKAAAPATAATGNISEMEKQLAQHSEAHSAIEEAEKEAKRLAQIETAKTSPEAMRNEQIQIAKKQAGLPPSTEMQALEQPYHLEKNLVSAQEKLDNVNSAIDSTLGRNLQHDVRIARRVFDTLDNERSTISKGYQEVERSLESKNVLVVKTKGIEQAMLELKNTLSPGMMETPEGKNLINMVANMETYENIPAKNVLAAMRTARDLARKMREKQFAPGTNAEERIALGDKAKELEEKYQDVSEKFEDAVGPEDSEALKKLNSAWKARVLPLQRNKVYQTMRFDKRLNWDLIKELRGDVKGNDIIKAAIKSDPETLKLVLGQRYYEAPESLFEPNETASEYLEHAPQVKSLLDSHKALTEQMNRLKELRPGVMGKAKEMTESLFKGRDLAERNELLNKHIAELEKVAKQKNISLKEKIKLEKQIKEAKALLPKEKEAKGLTSKDILGVSLGDLVPPTAKIPYKISRHFLMKALGKGEK